MSFLAPIFPACTLLKLLLPLPSAPQITSRIGKSFAQLLTSRAVLIAVGLAAVGGGRGRMFWGGAVEARRRGGGGRCDAVMGAPGGRSDGSGEIGSLEGGLGVILVGSAAAPRLSCCCVCVFDCDGGDALIVGVGGPDGSGVVLTPLVVSAAA